MSICIYVYMYICIFFYMYKCICIYLHMYVCINVYVYLYICRNVYMYLCIYGSMYICLYVYMYICTYVYVFVYLHRYWWCILGRYLWQIDGLDDIWENLNYSYFYPNLGTAGSPEWLAISVGDSHCAVCIGFWWIFQFSTGNVGASRWKVLSPNREVRLKNGLSLDFAYIVDCGWYFRDEFPMGPTLGKGVHSLLCWKLWLWLLSCPLFGMILARFPLPDGPSTTFLALSR